MNPLFWIFYFLDYVICIILTFVFTRYYASKTISRFILMISRLFLFCNYLLIFTLPYEIVYHNIKINSEKEQDSNDTNSTMVENKEEKELGFILIINYEIIFWVLITFSNLIIIYFISYLESGEFTFWRKILDSIKQNVIRLLIVIIILVILMAIFKDLITSLLLVFSLVNLIYALIFLGFSIIKLPRNMYIHSNTKLAIEYYEFKANKKLIKLNKNNEELKKIYFECKQTLVYVKNLEEYINNNCNKNEKSEAIEIELKNMNIVDGNNLENKNNNNAEIEGSEKIDEDNKSEESDKSLEKDKNKIEDDKINIEKDYKKYKSILKYKKYIDLLNSNVDEIIKKNNIEIVEEQNEEPIKQFKNIVKANARSKELDIDNERINSQIQKIYKAWIFLKGVSIDEENSPKEIDSSIQNDIKDINSSLKEDNYIQPIEIPKKKIEFYKKYNKLKYISLMIFFIILGILIILSEFSLILPVNISLFRLVFIHISNPVLIHILVILVSTLFFMFISFSFSKIKSMGRKYILFGGNQTNSLGILTYCQKLSTISFPMSMNIVGMIFHENLLKNKDNRYKTLLEDRYSKYVGDTTFYIICAFIPIFLIIVIIIYYFDIIGRICKKMRISFYVQNESRNKYISEGKKFLKKLNHKSLNNLKIKI